MDTATQAAISKAHENLAGDLAKVSQLIEPVNNRPLRFAAYFGTPAQFWMDLQIQKRTGPRVAT